MTEFLSKDIKFSAESSSKWYENVKTYLSHSQEPAPIVCNSQYLAYIDSTGGGSSVGVLPLTSYGKNHVPISSPAYQQPIIRAHGQPVQDIAFNPFDEHVLYSCSTDKYLKTWRIPSSGLVVDMNTADASFSPASKVPLRSLAAHTTSSNLVAVRGSREVSVVDVTTNQAVHVLNECLFAADLLQLAWGPTGDLLSVLSKDKTLKLFDPRVSTSGAVASVVAHKGVGYASASWLGATPLFLTAGQGQSQDRELLFWDSRALESGPVLQRFVDREAGTLIAAQGDGLLCVAGKGDRLVRLFRCASTADEASVELSDSPVAECDVAQSEVSASQDLIRGLAWLPGPQKQILVLSEGKIRPLTVSPKLKEECTPGGCGSDSNLSGNVDGDEDGDGGTETSGSAKSASKTAAVFGSGVVGKPALRYKHLYGREHVKDLTYYNLSPDCAALDSPLLAANEHYWSVPVRGGGGPVYVSPHSKFGKIAPDSLVLNGHKSAVSDMQYSPFHDHLLATGSQDGSIKLWDLLQVFPTDVPGPKTGVFTDYQSSLTAHTNSIRTVNFHPTIPHFLCSTSQDLTLRYHDLTTSQTMTSTTLRDQPTSASFNSLGDRLALALKDRTLSFFDTRTQTCSFASQTSDAISKYLGRNLRVLWCGRQGRTAADDPLVTVSSNPSTGLRQICLWDVRTLGASSTPVTCQTIDNASGQLFPMFDEGLNVVYVAGKGDTIIRAYELTSLNAPESGSESARFAMDKCSDFQTSREPIAGVCLLPKRVVDVGQVEVSRLLKLTADAVQPVSYHVPRAEHLKSFFHDDIYPDIRTKSLISTWSAEDWLNVDLDLTLFTPQYDSLQPAGMTKLSDQLKEQEVVAPSTKHSKLSTFRSQHEQLVVEQEEKEKVFNRLQQLAIQNAMYHKNLSGPVKIGGVVVSNPQLNANDDSDSDNDWD